MALVILMFVITITMRFNKYGPRIFRETTKTL